MNAAAPRALRIDVRNLLGDTQAPPHPNLVTRPTGRAVRDAIEKCLTGVGRAPFVSLIDLTRVPVLDFSCADEVVARLLVKYLRPDRPFDAFFLFRAAGDVHRHAVDTVLGRHDLAAVCDLGEEHCQLLGKASEDEGVAWRALEHRRRIAPGGLAPVLGDRGDTVLARLAERRLSFRGANGASLALSAVTSHCAPHMNHDGEDK